MNKENQKQSAKGRSQLLKQQVSIVGNDPLKEEVDLVVVGGGAAGFFGAITAAESNPALKILLLEKGPNVLSKVRISGGGRCNVTHACFDPAALITHYPRGSRELLGPFHSWQPADTVQWFQDKRVSLKTECDGRMFPVSDQSSSIVDCLLNTSIKSGVRIQTRCEVTQITPLKTGGFTILTNGEGDYKCRHVLWTAGGMKPGKQFKIIQSLGHHIIDPIPSLFTFEIKHPLINGLQGLSVPLAESSLIGTDVRCRGPMLITHWGLSGPAILRLSAWAAREIHAMSGPFEIEINWIPDINNPQTALLAFKEKHSKKLLTNSPALGLPKRLWQRLVGTVDVKPRMIWGGLRQSSLDQLCSILTQTRFKVSGKSRNKEEFVTCGGVDLKEIRFKTMESRRTPGLYFAGESLDIDAETGGFNFQAAWTTGYLAGSAIAASS
ncbi:MAG: aminoacetone oxidase family FAD-binding enzyme [Verrucomicrobia bacterium]|nr:aminoacetone oxidase family FAD-binding enzyme [Verrucomicrobiota bacterium]